MTKYEPHGHDAEMAAVHPQPDPPRLLDHATGEDLLNLGCGLYGFDGWHNVDVYPTAATQEVVDLDSCPWPWYDRTWDTVLMDNVLEHLADPLQALHELYRITAPGGRIIIRVPHVDSPAAYRPGHRSYWHEDSLTGFTNPRPAEQRNPESDHLFTTIHRQVQHRHPFAWHQRRWIGRELLAWGRQAIVWVLEPRTAARVEISLEDRVSRYG